MRKINYDQINTVNAGAPFKAGTIEHLAQSQREAIAWASVVSLPGAEFLITVPGTPYVIAGMESFFFGSIIQGALLYDGYGITSMATYTVGGGVGPGVDMTPLFQLEGTSDGVSKTGAEIFINPLVSGATSGSTPVWLCAGTFTGNGVDADPATFSNQVAYSIHQNWYIQIATTPTLNAGITPADIAYQIGTVSSLVYLYKQNPSVYDLYNVQLPTQNANIAAVQAQINNLDGVWTPYTPVLNTPIGGTTISSVTNLAGKYKILGGGYPGAHTMIIEFSFHASCTWYGDTGAGTGTPGIGTSLFTISMPTGFTWVPTSANGGACGTGYAIANWGSSSGAFSPLITLTDPTNVYGTNLICVRPVASCSSSMSVTGSITVEIA